ncbi:hypothetical protein CBM2599_A160097 [Cupriavidus taiwanensis]|uniref:nucleotidyltransferase domain-containing protein n=1 Tax=Cupriavidus taiwanensis TaxID=164546 RepID=UPI000E194B93|nr:nucleotidyltransferase domain-containing protein [Cupriavidus taiwanensis]SOY83432.1 hypothetical protein CBM2599_A160097 [Cupriavidus taiwanensis]SOY84885.1 hypothetical protein CBM2600_A140356 [Cupriavidus taiwanensis]
MHDKNGNAYRTLLRNQNWPGFEYYRDDILCHRLGDILADLEDQIPRWNAAQLASLMREGDLASSLEILRALRLVPGKINDLTLPLPAHSPVLYDIAVAAVLDTSRTRLSPRPVGQLDELLHGHGDACEVLGWFWEGAGPVREWLDNIGWNIGTSFDQSLDLPGLHSLVREGLVRQSRLPGGNSVVIKRDNPAKAGRLAKELRNVAEIVARLDLKDHLTVRPLDDKGAVSFAVVRPLAVIRTLSDGVCYSVMPLVRHPTLETVLMTQTNASGRGALLRKARLLLDFLYANGIVWGDMAPRNILVEQTAGATTFHILDFEKTDVVECPVSASQREAHARGPIFVEEFGAICSRDEVRQAFHPYFDPEAWDLESEAPLALLKPKREIMDLIGHRANSVSVGQYNRIELEVLPARFPQCGADGQPRHPLHVSFRVDHYLDANHDRMATEILMRAASRQQLCEVVDVLGESLKLLENAMFLRQLLRFIAFRVDSFDEEIKTRRAELSALIWHLYRVSDDGRLFANLLRNASIRHRLEYNRASVGNAAEDGGRLQRQNAAPTLALLRDGLPRLLNGAGNVLVVLHGGLAREEFGPASDIDIGVFCQDPALAARVRESIGKWAGTELTLSVEFLPVSNIEAIGGYAAQTPDSIVDFLCGEVLAGPPDLASRYRASVAALCQDDACKLAAKQYVGRYESMGDSLSAKRMLELLYLRGFVGNVLHDGASLAAIESERAPLLWRKNEEAFATAGKPAWSAKSEN